MYLARIATGRGYVFALRESYRVQQAYLSRELLRLGGNPGRFIHYQDSANFTLDEWIFAQLLAQGIEADPFELETLFFPFLDPLVQSRLNSFAERGKNRRWKPMQQEERNRINAATHLFDRRRLHFLRFGATDQQALDRAAPLFSVLLDKSRDEIEQLILAREAALKPHEYTRYIFTIFGLQQFFPESYARTMPDALNQEKLDTYFLAEICAIDRDDQFWLGYQRDKPLPEYLRRYLFMYFDWSTQDGLGWDAYIRAFNRARMRRDPPPRPGHRVSLDEISRAFGISRQELHGLSRKALTRLYRKKALELHPDRGGDHDRFISLNAAYQEILRLKQ